MKTSIRFTLCIFLCSLLSSFSYADATPLQHLQDAWAEAMYSAPAEQRIELLTALADEARAAAREQDNSAEIHIWQGIILSTLAGEKGGLGALGLAKEAKRSLDQAIAMDRKALDGSALTSIGTLYHKVPGWPIGFGSDKKAKAYLAEALAINPAGIDANYFMGEYLYDEGDHVQAKTFLQKASTAAGRPGRALADEGRKSDIAKLLALVDQELK
jgi:tetratricopeptide (TPR) repeat protein